MQEITQEEYILSNPEARQRLSSLLTAMGEPVAPDNTEGLLQATATLTNKYGREFVMHVMAAAHPDKEIIEESIQYVNGRNDFDRAINKSLYSFAAMSPWVKVPVLSVIVLLLVKAILGK